MTWLILGLYAVLIATWALYWPMMKRAHDALDAQIELNQLLKPALEDLIHIHPELEEPLRIAILECEQNERRLQQLQSASRVLAPWRKRGNR